jgi:hypothetical protein
MTDQPRRPLPLAGWWLLPLVTLAAPGLAAASPTPPPGDTLLDSAGRLEEGDTTREDGSLYDLYTVTGQAGQTLAITLESDDSGPTTLAAMAGPPVRGAAAPSQIQTLVVDSRATINVVSAHANPDILKELHQLLIAPIADLLPSDPEAKVAFIPQGSLFLVPFAALQDAEGTYLIEKHTILTAPSIQVLGLASQAARTQALRQAMVITLQRHPDPGSWAAFTLVGAAD